MPIALVFGRRHQAPLEESAAFALVAERFRRAGELQRAVALCRDGLRRFPDHVSARVTLGLALLDLERFHDARLELEEVLRRAPDNLAAIRGLAQLHDHGETDGGDSAGSGTVGQSGHEAMTSPASPGHLEIEDLPRGLSAL